MIVQGSNQLLPFQETGIASLLSAEQSAAGVFDLLDGDAVARREMLDPLSPAQHRVIVDCFRVLAARGRAVREERMRRAGIVGEPVVGCLIATAWRLGARGERIVAALLELQLDWDSRSAAEGGEHG